MSTTPPLVLYLTPSAPLRVALEDATLVVQASDCAERWLPLQRVSRIVANQHAELSTAALMACAERGITTVFVAGDGRPVARIMGKPGPHQELRQRLIELLDDADGEQRYRDWLYAQRRRVMLALSRRLQLPDPPRGPADFARLLEQVAQLWADMATAADLRLQLEGMATAWMAQHLQQLGVGAQSELLQDGSPDLVADLAGLLAWQAEPLRLGLLRRRYERVQRDGGEVRPVRRREAIRLWQRNGARMGRCGRDLSNRLQRWLSDSA